MLSIALMALPVLFKTSVENDDVDIILEHETVVATLVLCNRMMKLKKLTVKKAGNLYRCYYFFVFPTYPLVLLVPSAIFLP